MTPEAAALATAMLDTAGPTAALPRRARQPRLPTRTNQPLVLSPATPGTPSRSLAITDTPAAAHGRAGTTETFRALHAPLVLARLLRLPTRTNQALVLSPATPETRWRSLVIRGTPAAAHGRAGSTDSLRALDAVLVLARLVRLPHLTKPLMVLLQAMSETR